ncbi:hypothetical protein D3C87_2089680 [compost metagenome]
MCFGKPVAFGYEVQNQYLVVVIFLLGQIVDRSNLVLLNEFIFPYETTIKTGLE